MKRASLQRRKSLLGALLLVISTLTVINQPVASAFSVGSSPCVQTVDSTAGVSVYQEGNYCYVSFKSTRVYAWTPPTGVSSIDLLIVGGGGGGGARHAGGGGAGGLINLTAQTISASNISIVVGGGGAGGPATSSGDAGSEGSNGGNSQVAGGGITTQIAYGGGGGAWAATSGSGASSGGGGCCGQQLGGAVTGQGKVGGAGYTITNSLWAGGGGGGFGAVGAAATSAGAGNGGIGGDVAWITSTAQSALSVGHFVDSKVYFAGGGGGSTTSGTAGSGGKGGGGAGVNNTSAGSAGSANTGGGGGGGGMNGSGASKGGDGGSGVVVIRYMWDVTAPVITGPNSATGATSTKSIAEGSTAVHTFAANETVTWSISGTDSSFFLITSGGVLTISVRNFESPQDSGGDNTYVVEISATDSVNLVSTQTLTVTITNVNEAPIISGPSGGETYTVSIAENSSSIATFTASDVDAGTTFSWSLSGTDAGDFSVVTGTGALSFAVSPDFEAPTDFDNNNIYTFVVTVSDGALVDSQTVTINVTGVNEASILGDPSTSGTLYKGIATSISVSLNAAGKVRFFVGGKRIANCLAVPTLGSGSNYTATCNWKPAVQGRQILSANFAPTSNTFTSATSSKVTVFILKRSGTRP